MENQEIKSNSADVLSEEEKERIEMEKKKEEEQKKRKRNKIIAISAVILLILAGLAFYLPNRTGGASILGIFFGGGDGKSGGQVPGRDNHGSKPNEGKGGGGGPINDPNGDNNDTGGFPGTGPGGGPDGTGAGGGIPPCANPPCENTSQPPKRCKGKDCPKPVDDLCIGGNCSALGNSCTGFYDIDLKDAMGIFFALNKSVPFGCSDEVQIKPYAEAYISQNITKNILVEGYSCDLGEDDYNMKLSKRRAEYVKNALVSAGVPENRIKIKWYGSTMFGKAGFGAKPRYRRAQISLR